MKSPARSTLIAAAFAVCMHSVLGQPSEPMPVPTQPPATAASEPSVQETGAPDKASMLSSATKPPNLDSNPDTLFEFVKVSDHPFYHGSGLFALGGALGGLAAASVYKDEPDRIAAFVKQERIDIAAIVRSEFERQFVQKPQAKQAFQSKGPGKFQMQILYGITSVPFSDYRPYLAVRMRLVDSAGTEKWKDREYVGGHGNAKAIPYADFFVSANTFASEFEVAANEVVQLLLKDFLR